MADTTPDGYRLISADSHVNEPPDLWTTRVPAGLRDRAPRIERFEQGDAWVLEGVADPITFGMNACAGMAPEEMRGWMRFEDIRRRRLRPRGAPRGAGPRRRRRRGALPHARVSARRSSPTTTSSTTRRWCARTTTGCRSTWSTRPSASAGSR